MLVTKHFACCKTIHNALLNFVYVVIKQFLLKQTDVFKVYLFLHSSGSHVIMAW